MASICPAAGDAEEHVMDPQRRQVAPTPLLVFAIVGQAAAKPPRLGLSLRGGLPVAAGRGAVQDTASAKSAANGAPMRKDRRCIGFPPRNEKFSSSAPIGHEKKTGEKKIEERKLRFVILFPHLPFRSSSFLDPPPHARRAALWRAQTFSNAFAYCSTNSGFSWRKRARLIARAFTSSQPGRTLGSVGRWCHHCGSE